VTLNLFCSYFAMILGLALMYGARFEPDPVKRVQAALMGLFCMLASFVWPGWWTP
jgi:hypothetical protein